MTVGLLFKSLGIGHPLVFIALMRCETRITPNNIVSLSILTLLPCRVCVSLVSPDSVLSLSLNYTLVASVAVFTHLIGAREFPELMYTHIYTHHTHQLYY